METLAATGDLRLAVIQEPQPVNVPEPSHRRLLGWHSRLWAGGGERQEHDPWDGLPATLLTLMAERTLYSSVIIH